MNNLELRPLSLGEVLDRTFTLYRTNFLLFVGLAGIPRLPVLVASLVNLQMGNVASFTWSISMIGFLALIYILAFVGYLFAQGGSVLAVSELYLGRTTTITQTLRRVADDIGSLLGVLFLNGLAIGAGFIFLIVPGIFLMCRLFVCVPAAIIEKKSPSQSLSRSWDLTSGFAGRAFVILCLYFVLAIGFASLTTIPISLALVASANDPGAVRAWGSVQAVLSTFVEVLLTPILLVATSIYYYDLRVRKEAFDLQFMMDPDSANIPRASLRSVVPEGQ